MEKTEDFYKNNYVGIKSFEFIFSDNKISDISIIMNFIKKIK